MSGYVCPECGLEYDSISPADGEVAVKSFPRRYRSALAAAIEDEHDDSIIVRRPAPEVWSALEYTAHVADILAASAHWIADIRSKDKPTLQMPSGGVFADVEGSPAAASKVESVLTALTAGADALAYELDRVGSDEWDRTGTFPWGERDQLMTMRNAVHEGSHHLRDVEKVLSQVRGRQ